MCQIIGRKQEIAELSRVFESGRAEFVAVYGRRRVGKTFLINEVFRDNMTFRHTGLSPYDRTRKVTLRDQLQNFHFSLVRHGMEGGEVPRSWKHSLDLNSFWNGKTMGHARLYSLMNCHGWTHPAQASLLLLRHFGMVGHAVVITYVLLFADRQPLGCLITS